MKRLAIVLGVMIASGAFAQEAKLTLEQYLEQVRKQNPQARAAIAMVDSLENSQREAVGVVRPELYATYNLSDDKRETVQPAFQGDRTRATNWKTGVRSQTTVGLGVDVRFESTRVNLNNVNPSFLPVNDYNESRAVLELRQSLWRNGLGRVIENELDANLAKARAGLLDAKFKLKMLLLEAENKYWALVSLQQVIKLQEENVDRARKLRDLMSKRAQQRLFDDVDAMQSEASFQTRELELENSMIARTTLINEFNTLRGLDADTVVPLEELPKATVIAMVNQKGSGKMSREDFERLREEARVRIHESKARQSLLNPKFDLVGQFASNGRDADTDSAFRKVNRGAHPNWVAGIEFSVPIDFVLTGKLKRAARQSRTAGENMLAQAEFQEARFWNDIVKQRAGAQARFERSAKLEDLQTEIVKKKRVQLLNGRATTFETLKLEQELAGAQIQRVQAQQQLLGIHNMIKTFEVAQ